VDDILKTMAKFESKGIKFYGNPKVCEEGVSYFATSKDPEDNWIQISQ
jgi:hypothetical protein